VAAIIQFVVEGDNRGDAAFLAGTIARITGQEVKEWVQPKSWKNGLFGTPCDETLYG
jgi:proteasome assembly chaperone 2